ncbi:MAG: YXWGXW repeat-containing protein, partial [Blastocatellia bacterium]
MRNVRWIHLLLLALVIAAVPAALPAQVSVGVSVRIGPPALPVYAQPICPGAGYIWTPGYWGYGPAGYFWVPGTWVLAPRPGFLWTPGYWGWGGGFYAWRAGYWGPHVGFYGGVNYGFGYGGVGFAGGYWNHGAFYYNRSVSNVNVTNIHNTYNRTVINNVTVNRVSYNGGAGGTMARPTANEEAAAREQHISPTAEQTQHREAASQNRAQLASVNHGRPAIAATPRPGQFSGRGVEQARQGGAPYRAGNNENRANRNQNRPANESRQERGAHPNA